MSDVSSSVRIAVGKRFLATRVGRVDRVSIALCVVFVLAGAFYLWIASLSEPLSLHDGVADRYNLLASAFLHFRLSVGSAPAALTHLANPYNPYLNSPFTAGVNDATSINDDILYRGQLYFEWGPAPALVWLVPLHLLGFEPTAGVTVSVFAIVGLGFALATLRVLLRHIGGRTPMWMCILAGLALALSSVVPFLLHSPNVTMDTLAGGYCFTMAGIWLAVSALSNGRASAMHLVLMSLCFGLAANSRPTLALPAVMLVPVYLALRSSRPTRGLLLSIALPFSICIALLLAYNQARFHNPLEVGAHYQLAGYESRTAPLGRLSYMLPGFGFYAFTPPQPKILFPFILLKTPQASTPTGLAVPEATGGLLPMAPIVIFIAALPWIWRRRPQLLGRLAVPLMLLAGAGVAIVLLSSYQFFASTERYETDFATLLVLGGLAGWLSLSNGSRGVRRGLLRVVGGLLVAWGCVTGFAVTFAGGAPLAQTHPETWRTLEGIGSPVSTAIAAAIGHPVVAEVVAAHEAGTAASSTSLGTPITELSLGAVEQAHLTVVSPYSGSAILAAEVSLAPGARYGIRVSGPGSTSHSYAVPSKGGSIAIPVRLGLGLNRLTLSPVSTAVDHVAGAAQVMLISDLTVGRSQR